MPSSGYVALHSKVLANTLKKNKTAEAKRRFLEYSMNSQLDYNSTCARAHGESKLGASHAPHQNPTSTAAPEHRRCLETRNIQNLKRKYHICGCVSVLRQCGKWKLSLWCFCLQACFSKL